MSTILTKSYLKAIGLKREYFYFYFLFGLVFKFTRSKISISISICVLILNFSFVFLDSGSQLLVCNPNVYGCSIPVTFHQELVHMPQLCARSRSSEIPSRHLTTLQSAQGQNFLHFAKSDFFLDGMSNHHQTICYNTAIGLLWVAKRKTSDYSWEPKQKRRKDKERKGRREVSLQTFASSTWMEGLLIQPQKYLKPIQPGVSENSQSAARIGHRTTTISIFFHSLSCYLKPSLLSSPLHYLASSLWFWHFPS